MKTLLDNCVAYRAKELFAAHEIQHTSDVGFEALGNGDLIARASDRFDLLATTDKKIRYEQNLDSLPVSILELNTLLTRFADLQTLTPFLEDALEATKYYRFVSVGADGKIEKLAPRHSVRD
ncbi:MAG TPA: hypothetical protein VFC78_09695 [Tepidisphaeraceae bacterium]|nr:hypothetical protein [Tepidisphaeraceae bacterium]